MTEKPSTSTWIPVGEAGRRIDYPVTHRFKMPPLKRLSPRRKIPQITEDNWKRVTGRLDEILPGWRQGQSAIDAHLHSFETPVVDPAKFRRF